MRRRPKRWLAGIALVGLLLALLGYGGWGAAQGDSSPLVVGGAADLQIEDRRLGERVISYRMPRPEDGWVSAVGRRLKLSGWLLDTASYEWGNTERFVPVYVREQSILNLRISDRVELRGDRERAVIVSQRSYSWIWPAVVRAFTR